jgi:hypothetical protein
MAYITRLDYAEITGDTGDIPDFSAVCSLAEAVIDAHTLYGYVGRDITSLPAYIASVLKQAVAYQAQYIIQLGGTEGANDPGGDMGTVSLGKFSYSAGSRNGSSGDSSDSSGGIPLSKAAAAHIPLLKAYVNTMRWAANWS